LVHDLVFIVDKIMEEWRMRYFGTLSFIDQRDSRIKKMESTAWVSEWS